MKYRRLGNSGICVSALSLGFWNNFGDNNGFQTQKEIVEEAFDSGITYFDLANNYGPPAGSAESNFGRIMKEGLSAHRHEMVIATKAGYDMWDGPYGKGGSRKHLITSLDHSLKRLGLDYVDLFYSHTPDLTTPFEETADALSQIIQSGKALYIGLSNYDAEQTVKMVTLLKERRVPIIVHQPSYNMINHWAEDTLFPELRRLELSAAVYSPLAQGLLTSRYLDGIPEDSRAEGDTNRWLTPDHVYEHSRLIHDLNEMAASRYQSLSQMALAWNLRDDIVATNIIGVSRISQLQDNLEAIYSDPFTEAELKAIEKIMLIGGIF